MSSKKSRQEIMEERLQDALKPEFLQIENQSALHKGHAGDDGTGETHYKILISSNELKALSRLQQHRKVFDSLGADIARDTHSISITVK